MSSMSLVAHKGSLALFGIVFGFFQFFLGCFTSFQVVLACYDHFAKCFDLQTCYKRTSYQILLQTRADFITKWDSFDVLQNRATAIAKWDNFFVLKSEARGITKQGKYYKVGQFLFQSRTVITKRGNFYQKVRQVLKIGAIITKWGSTSITVQ